jgi:hypothetical protein
LVIIKAVSSFCVLAAGRRASAFFWKRTSPLCASMTMADSAASEGAADFPRRGSAAGEKKNGNKKQGGLHVCFSTKA